MRSVMTNQFNQVPQAEIPRSSFNLSHGMKTTFDADDLIPIGVWDVIPGDTWNVQTSHFIRLTPTATQHPLLDNLEITLHYFYVPYRLIWDNFEKFMGAQDDPGDSIDFTIPQNPSPGGSGHVLGSLGDYFGIPTGVITDVSALPFRAYNLIFNDWYRDENLQDSLTVQTGNGPDTPGNYLIRKRGKRFDYFTGALPFPQKGTAVSIPLGTTAPIFTDQTGASARFLSVQTSDGVERLINNPSGTNVQTATGTASPGQALEADLSSATAATINDLRLAFQTQRLLERDARSGTRYVETLQAHWGVTSPDFRLQRPEYLGGGSSPVNISPIAQQSASTTPAADDTLGQMAGIGTSQGSTGFTKSFVEHGVILCLANAHGDITYSQGLDRYWSKQTRYEMMYPVLTGIGEQAILNKEIYLQNTSADDDVFGYIPRYEEFRFLNSKVTGLFRPSAAGTLASWTLSEEFGSLPTLGASFIEANLSPQLDRAIAIPSEPQFIADFYHKIKAARPLPAYGVPGNLDRL